MALRTENAGTPGGGRTAARRDAARRARVAVTQAPEAWTPPPAERRQFPGLGRHLDDLMAQPRHWPPRLTASRPVAVVPTSVQTVRAVVEDHLPPVPPPRRDPVPHAPGCARPQAWRTSIPGIGEVTATRLLAEMAPLARGQAARHAAGRRGRGRTRRSTIGHARVRQALYGPAIAAGRCPPHLGAFGPRLRARGQANRVGMGAARRQLVHRAYGGLTTGTPCDAPQAVGAVPTHAP